MRGMSKVLPPPGLPRAIAFQSAVLAVGGGTFLTGSVVFFTHVVGLSPVQIGAGLSIAGLTSLATSLPLGGLADRLGGQRAWVIGALVEAAAMAGYPVFRSFLAFVVLMALAAAGDSFANAGRTLYTADAIPPENRVRTMAFARSYLNIGFTIGAGLGAAALAVSSTAALVAMVALNAGVLVVNAMVVSRLPAAPSHQATAKVSRLTVLTDVPYLVLCVVFGVLWFHGALFTEVIPLWAITHTDAPKPVLGALFALNTVMAVTLQVPATRGLTSLAGTAKLLRRGALAAAVAGPVVALTGRTNGWWTVGLLALAIVLITGTELWVSASQWFIQTDTLPAAQRGAYVGLGQTVGAAGRMVAPAGLTLLAISTGGWGWWIVAAIFVACGIAAGPVIGWVGRTSRVDVRPVPSAPKGLLMPDVHYGQQTSNIGSP
jgi:MFS family permease